MTGSIFGSETPASADLADGVAYTMGTRFTVDVDGTATHGRWFFPATIPDAAIQAQAGIYRNSDSILLGSVSFPLNATLGAWNQAAFPTPIPLAAGVEYTAVIWTPLRYVATSAYPWPTTVGNITAPAAAGRFREAPAGFDGIPTSTFNSGAYFADLVFEPAGSPTAVTPAGLAVSVSPGTPTTGLPGSAPSGAPVGASAGTPSVALSRSAAPTGANAPTSPGTPLLALLGASAGGVQATTAPGAPSATTSVTASPSGATVAVRLGQPATGQPPSRYVTRPNRGTVSRPDRGLVIRP